MSDDIVFIPFVHPSTFMLAGMFFVMILYCYPIKLFSGLTSCGKSEFLFQLIKWRKVMITPVPERYILIYKRYQPIYDRMKKLIPNFEFYNQIPENIDDDDFLNTKIRNFLILDDCLLSSEKDNRIGSLFIEGSHHRNLRF